MKRKKLPKMPALPGLPPEVRQDWNLMFETIYHFTHGCKEHGLLPWKCYASIVVCFIAQFKPEESEYIRNIVAAGTNEALSVCQMVKKIVEK